MKKINLLIQVCFMIFTIAFLKAQDNPNLDRIPEYLFNRVIFEYPLMPVVTIGYYDNFNFGTNTAEPHVSSNPRNPLWIFHAWNTNGTYYSINGYDWTVNNPNFPNTAGDPCTAYDSLGNLFYETMKSPITGTWIAKSTNNAQSWVYTNMTGVTGNDKNWIAADQTNGPYANYIYTTMTPGYFARSTNNGSTFVETDYMSNSIPGMMVAVGPNGNVQGGSVYVVTNTGNQYASTYTFYRSTNGGSTFSLVSYQNFAGIVGTIVDGRHSVHNMRTRPYPFIASDNSYGTYRGRLYCVYASNDPPGNGNKPDIYCRYSSDYGLNWSSEVRVNDDANSQNNYQWHPAIWCDKETGKLYIHWMDTRNCPTTDSAEIYASYTTNGGVSFVTNQQISNKKMKINCTTCPGGGTPRYQGDYNSATSNSKCAFFVWTDFRNGSFGSYGAYFPDFALNTNVSSLALANNNDSGFVVTRIPSVKLYTDVVKFNTSVTPNPSNGSIQVNFIGRDSLTSYPDSVRIRIRTIGNVTSGMYTLTITAQGPNGTPVHKRFVNLLVNTSQIVVGTNRNGIADFKVNGVTYNTQQTFYFTNGSNVSIQALSPKTVGANQYVFVNWSNSGDTTQVITVTNNLTLLATYKIRYKLTISSLVGNTFGGNIFYDSASSFTFGVLSRAANYNGQWYTFRGWDGSGPGAYTSPDSSGNDSAVTWSMNNPILETARWTPMIGIENITTEIPKEYKLYQNYPNPFNPITLIEFDLPKHSNVRISIYDITGREVDVILNQSLNPGKYKIDYSALALASGIYFYRIIANEFSYIRKMILIK